MARRLWAAVDRAFGTIAGKARAQIGHGHICGAIVDQPRKQTRLSCSQRRQTTLRKVSLTSQLAKRASIAAAHSRTREPGVYVYPDPDPRTSKRAFGDVCVPF
jgi:hypothetical protein